MGCLYRILGSIPLSCVGRQNRPECVSCSPTTRSSVPPTCCRWAARRISSSSARPRRVCSAALQLVGVCTGLGSNGNRLPSPDQFCSAESEMAPPAAGVIRRISIGEPVPSFHWMDCKPIADGFRAEREGLCEWRIGRCEDVPVGWQRQAEVLEAFLKSLDGLQMSNADDVSTLHETIPVAGSRGLASPESGRSPVASASFPVFFRIKPVRAPVRAVCLSPRKGQWKPGGHPPCCRRHTRVSKYSESPMTAQIIDLNGRWA